MSYHRTDEQKAGDYRRAREWEMEVAGMFDPATFLGNFEATDRLDLWFPGVYLELKEKRQSYTPRWHLLPGVPERDLFIIDELTVKRSLQHYPNVLFLIRDVPGQRLFHAPVWEMISVERARVNRVNKGKWVIDMGNFRTVDDPATSKSLFVRQLVKQHWKDSSVASAKEIPQA